jgi:hypothetical protein
MSLQISHLLKGVLYKTSKPILERVCKLKDIHKGESCYIFGDGVSIKRMDLKLFSDKTSIAVNFFPFHKDFSAINCMHSVINAPYFFSPFFGYTREAKNFLYLMSEHYRDMMLINRNVNYYIDLSNYPFVRGDNVYHTFRNIPDPRLPSNFIGNRINCFSGALAAATMLAIYLGYDDIHLVGCDYTHMPHRNMHWYEKGEGNCLPNPDTEVNRIFFEIAKEFVNITTIVPEGTSAYLNAVTYKDYTGHDLIYRENVDLMDYKYLKSLATWSGYTIF